MAHRQIVNSRRPPISTPGSVREGCSQSVPLLLVPCLKLNVHDLKLYSTLGVKDERVGDGLKMEDISTYFFFNERLEVISSKLRIVMSELI